MRTRTLLAISFSLSVAAVLSMHLRSYYVIQSRNGFFRIFAPHAVTIEKSLDLRFNSHYIAGTTSSKIYLGDLSRTNTLFESDYFLKDTQTVQLSFPKKDRIAWKILSCRVDSPIIFAFEGLTPNLFKGSIGSVNMNRVPGLINSFDNLMPISGSSWLLRTSDRVKRQIELAKETEGKQRRDFIDGILENQQDGLFSVDGKIRFERLQSRIIYLYYYRNQFICMDTNLHVLYRANTIDTNTLAKIKPVHLLSEGAWKLSAPPLFVNRNCCVSEKRLFVISGLAANNESRKAFDQNSVIDVYSIENGKYRFSFYLPSFLSGKAYEFQVAQDKLVALYDHYLVVYKLNFSN